MSHASRFSPVVWTLFTTTGLAGGLVAGLLLGMPLGQIANAMIVTAAVTGVVGAVLGGMQAISLRRLLSRPLWWIVSTVAGLGAGLSTAVVVVETVGTAIAGKRPNVFHLSSPMRALSFIALGLVAGTVVGLAQWLVLRRQIPRIKHWVLTTGAGLAIAFSASSLVVDLSTIGLRSAVGGALFVTLSGILFGLVTSLPLRRAAITPS
ncbi:MAG TPA: hypothetical protein VEZ11_13570 [Thermoanaerobaculia bacterium]|nr:hypothetical protein [Thermoanaerobaculia bacterium]